MRTREEVAEELTSAATRVLKEAGVESGEEDRARITGSSYSEDYEDDGTTYKQGSAW